MAETAFRRAWREFPALLTGSPRMWLWLTIWGLVGTGAGVYLAWESSRSGGVVIAVGSLAVGLVIAVATAFGALWVTAPVRQRDEARKLAARLQESTGFPDVVITTQQVMNVGPADAEAYLGEQTLLAIGIHAVNRERDRRAILEFKAFVQTGEPRPGVWQLRTSDETLLPNPLKLDPQDIQTGELIVAWGHDMDFVFGRDLSREDAVARVVDDLRLTAKDHLSGVSVVLEVPGTWQS